jgi:hypothetical protein
MNIFRDNFIFSSHRRVIPGNDFHKTVFLGQCDLDSHIAVMSEMQKITAKNRNPHQNESIFKHGHINTKYSLPKGSWCSVLRVVMAMGWTSDG